MGGRVALELRRGVVAPEDGGVAGLSAGGVLRERLFDREAVPCFGLPRDFGGMEMAGDLGGMAAVLDGGLPFLSGAGDFGGPLGGAAGLPPGRRPSRVALISGGIGI